MNIKSNNINNSINFQMLKTKAQGYDEQEHYTQKQTELPSVYPVGQSQVNSSVPVSYSLIGEISIPGLKEKAKIYKLSNGQRVIIAPKKGPAFIRTAYNVGSMNEPDNIRGMSHFIEHNLFNGSKNLAPKEYDRKLSELGGDTNATTGFALTDYYLQIQLIKDNSLEEAIKLNAEQTQFPIFPVEQLIKEKEPVKSEIDMCNDNSNTVAVCKVLKKLFNVKTQSEDFIIGTKANINSFSKNDVVDYFNTWYTPDNAVTVITGDVNADETIEIVSKYFNKKNDYSNIHKRYYEPIEYNNKAVREDIIRSNTTQPSVVMGFAIPEGTSNTDLKKIDALFSIMSATNSTFYKAMNSLGASIDIEIENMQNKPKGAKAAIITAYAPEEKLEDVINAIYSEITNLSNNTISEYDINNVKKSMTNRLLGVTENSAMLNALLTNAAMNDNYDYINSSVNIIQNISPDDITETARKYLDLNKISICVSHDSSASAETINQQYNKSKTVSFKGKINPIDNIKEETNKIIQTKLPNNIESTVISANPCARSCIILDFNAEELNKTCLSELMVLSEMLNRGSAIRGADNFNNILNEKDITMSVETDTDGIRLCAKCNSENITELMRLIKEKLSNPNLTHEEFIRAKQLVKEAFQSENVSAFNKLNSELYCKLDKYKDKQTRLTRLNELTLEDIQALYTKILTNAQVQALMSAPTEINPSLTNTFNNELIEGFRNFKPFSPEKTQSYNIYTPVNEEKTLVQEREQAQADVIQGYKFKKTENIDDIAKIELLNMILGSSGMSSRLFLDLREDKKLAYSVNSRLEFEKDTGVLFLRIGTTTENPDPNEGSSENINKALEGFKRNVELLKTQEVSEKELENAKIIYKTRILNSLETNMSKSLNYINTKYSYYGINYNEKLFEAIDKISPKDIKAAANYVFKNPAITSIAASKKTLRELNLI